VAKRLSVLNLLRPKILSQGVADMETIAGRVAKNTTFNQDEIYGIVRLYVREAIAALQAGETVKLDGFLSVSPNMKVGGTVKLSIRGDRQAVSSLNNPLLWTAAKVLNHANLSKSSDEIVAQWDQEHPDDPVTD
jgi:hypothetical protein